MDEAQRQAALAADREHWGEAPAPEPTPVKSKAKRPYAVGPHHLPASISEIWAAGGRVRCTTCRSSYASAEGLRIKTIPTYWRDEFGNRRATPARVLACGKCGVVQFDGLKP